MSGCVILFLVGDTVLDSLTWAVKPAGLTSSSNPSERVISKSLISSFSSDIELISFANAAHSCISSASAPNTDLPDTTFAYSTGLSKGFSTISLFFSQK